MTEAPEDEAEQPADAAPDPGADLFAALLAVCEGHELDQVANEAANLLAYAIVNGSQSHEDARRAVVAYGDNIAKFTALNMRGKPKKRLIVSRLQ